jgi:hypothetical protein
MPIFMVGYIADSFGRIYILTLAPSSRKVDQAMELFCGWTATFDG